MEMEEVHRDDGFEVTFVVSAPRAEVWKRLADARPASDALTPPTAGQWWIPGVEGAADELEVEPEELLRTRKASFPCQGTEIVVTMEDAETGTRITFAQFGFGPGFDAATSVARGRVVVDPRRPLPLLRARGRRRPAPSAVVRHRV